MVSKAMRERIRMLFGGRCAYCGIELPAKWHVDHVKPVIRQFSHYENGRLVPTGNVSRPENECEDNLFPACVACNIDKATYSLDGWRQKLENSCDVLGKRSAMYKHGVRFGVITETRKPIVFYFETLQEPTP